MYKVKVNGITLSFGKNYESKTLEEVLEMVLKLSKAMIITDLSISEE